MTDSTTTKTVKVPVSRRRTRPWWRSALKHIALILAALLMIYPLIWMLAASFKPDAVIFQDLSIFSGSFTTENYAKGWTTLQYPFGTYLLNSAILVAGCIIGNLISCSMAAYAFARLRFSGRRWMFAAMLVSIMLPFHVVIIPQYILFSQIGWLNTFLPIIVPKLLATDAFFVFLMVQFIRGLPKDLDEAARIDGAGHPRIFLQVILPLMVPALATTAIFTFIWTWSDFFSQLIYLTDPSVLTVPVALRLFIDPTTQSSFGAMFAMSIVSLLPLFIIFLVGQRFLVKGVATTGLK